LGLGKIKGVHAHYDDGDILQTANLTGKTGVIATVTGKEVRRSLEVERIVDVIHGALEGNEITVNGQSEENPEIGVDARKADERREQWDALGSS